MIRLMIVHLTPMKNVLSAEVEFEFYFCVLEKKEVKYYFLENKNILDYLKE